MALANQSDPRHGWRSTRRLRFTLLDSHFGPLSCYITVCCAGIIGPVLLTRGDKDEVISREAMERWVLVKRAAWAHAGTLWLCIGDGLHGAMWKKESWGDVDALS